MRLPEETAIEPFAREIVGEVGEETVVEEVGEETALGEGGEETESFCAAVSGAELAAAALPRPAEPCSIAEVEATCSTLLAVEGSGTVIAAATSTPTSFFDAGSNAAVFCGARSGSSAGR